ncbi:MAG: ABC transporter permease subunit [Oscillospiraceae bacterium]|nr:ABC transporter permease subunit [Oscillospiraceae bacterium]
MSLIRNIRKNFGLYMMAVPGLLFFATFSMFPTYCHTLAFKDYRPMDGIFGSAWAGLQNFRFFFSNSDWLNVTRNTLTLNFMFISLTISIALLIAIFLDEVGNAFAKRFMQSLIFLPYFVSWLVVSILAFALLNQSTGVINVVLRAFGQEGLPFYNTADVWPAILTFIYVWRFCGWYSIIFLSAITAISPDFYEAARIDGANRVQQVWHITLPLLRGTAIMLVLLAVGRIFYGDFGMIYGIVGDNGLLYETTDIIDTFAFRALRRSGDFGMAAAVTLYQSVMGFITILIFNRLIKAVDKDYVLF